MANILYFAINLFHSSAHSIECNAIASYLKHVYMYTNMSYVSLFSIESNKKYEKRILEREQT